MAKDTKKIIRVAELFAGVGGFHIGLDRASKGNSKAKFHTTWADQWEPASGKNQHAAWVYQNFINSKKLTTKLCNDNIWDIVGTGDSISERIDEPKEFEILTGGFPCQDYSVARPLSQSAGLEGKKGVLWWSIYKLLHNAQVKHPKKPAPYIFLENVDRLIKSPASKRGRDFAIMLSSLSQLGYIVEWRVINAAEYGFPQRRRRTFIVGYHKSSTIAKEILKEKGFNLEVLVKWVENKGILAEAFPVNSTEEAGHFTIGEDPYEITKNFIPEAIDGKVNHSDPFKNSGMMIDLHVFTEKVTPRYTGSYVTLGDIVGATIEKEVPENYYIHPDRVPAWEKQKGAHDYDRTSKSGHTYRYKEGAVPFPDPLTKASRTIVTGEGGSGPSRMKHVIDIRKKKGFPNGRTINGVTYVYRRLIPEELEQLCMFDRGHTEFMDVEGKHELERASDAKRAFFMGNALVVGVIEGIGKSLLKRIVKHENK
ncbi:MAG TPA: DNA (cytosine-5-)-methyltransferase [Candidatus Paceibacterota bacterium]|nr:DNA (cytosine-5-)-methyltransferase [Candidatus Paceibacterota bacterium]